MKPYELYQQWSQFEAMMASPSLSNEDKLQMGTEWIAALPPAQLCVSSTLSRVAVGNAMSGRLNDLKEKINGSTIGKTKEAASKKAGKEPAPSSKRPSKKSV